MLLPFSIFSSLSLCPTRSVVFLGPVHATSIHGFGSAYTETERRERVGKQKSHALAVSTDGSPLSVDGAAALADDFLVSISQIDADSPSFILS